MCSHEIKYAVYPGYVRSQRDRDAHFIGAHQLMRLYGVRPEECLIVPERVPPGHERLHALLVERVESQGLIRLAPSYSGDYRIPTK